MKTKVSNFPRSWVRNARHAASEQCFEDSDIICMEQALNQALNRLIAVGHPSADEHNSEATKKMLALAILEAASDVGSDPQILATHALRRLHDM